MIAFALTAMYSCEEDPLNNSDDPRDKYSGVWKCYETSELFGDQTYQVEIYKDDLSDNKIIINNFSGLGYGFEAFAIVDGKNLDFPQQTIDNTMISGSGEVVDNYNTIEWTFDFELVDTKKGAKRIMDSMLATYEKQ